MLTDETVEAIAREFCVLENMDPDADSGLVFATTDQSKKNWELYVPEIRRTYNILSAIERYTNVRA